jgi:hypothetical protein
MRQDGTEYRLASHRCGNGAEDSRQRQERGKCLAKTSTTEGREGDEKDEAE